MGYRENELKLPKVRFNFPKWLVIFELTLLIQRTWELESVFCPELWNSTLTTFLNLFIYL